MKVPAKLSPLSGTTLGNITATALLRGIDSRDDISASHCEPQVLGTVLRRVQKLRLNVLSFAKVYTFRT